MSANNRSHRTRVALLALMLGPGVTCAPLAAAGDTTASSAPSHFTVAPGQVKWSDPPAAMGRGKPSIDAGLPLRFALLQGDPSKPGVPFTIRLGCGDGYIAAPHWHPTDENIVVLKGAFLLGAGDTFDPIGMQEISAGGYGYMPRRMHHFGQCKGDTDILVYGVGPFQINWVPAARKPAAKQP